MRIVAAVGGNALLRRGQPLTSASQVANLHVAGESLAALIRTGNNVIVSHGNGPQIGLLALQNEAIPQSEFPLDVLGAESQGMIGYQLQMALDGALGGEHVFATVLTRILVDPHDEAWASPSKPIGPAYDRETAERLAKERNWKIAPDGPYWRRVVASPEPLELLEARANKYAGRRWSDSDLRGGAAAFRWPKRQRGGCMESRRSSTRTSRALCLPGSCVLTSFFC